MNCRSVLFLSRLFTSFAVLTVASLAAAPGPVQFTFTLPAPAERDAPTTNPYARDLWAELDTPAGRMIRLPVYFAGSDRFAVRARATETGDYRFLRLVEVIDGRPVPLSPRVEPGEVVTVTEPQTLPAVRVSSTTPPARLVQAGGRPYVPIGANLAWPPAGRAAWYARALAEFRREGLNWARVWMAHWSGLNLEWLPEDLGPSPPPGVLDSRVAAEWDQIVAAAEEHGVYLQIVLQHHGQYSTRVNPNWADHPWNAARPGGFLEKPADFFTSPVARGLTALKYRYIVARWGYSPAVLAWELFNEVHWVDALHQDRDVEAVARWHAEMAAFLRSVDAYRHPITTSTEDLASPIYAEMDFFQPHLYAANMLAGARTFAQAPSTLPRPVFYGEVGDDHMGLDPAQKAAGVAIVPPVWASLMGAGTLPAQPWLGAELLQKNRLGELGAVARFLAATGLAGRDELEPFSPAVESEARVPFVLRAGQAWQRRPGPDFALPLDGREPLELADVPKAYVGTAASLADGFPGRAVYRLAFPRDLTLRARVTGVGAQGSALRIVVDGRPVLEHAWPAGTTLAADRPDVLTFDVPTGRRELVVENPGAPDWFELAAIEFPLDVPALAAIGRRGADFVALWLWHREGVFAVDPPAPATGTVRLEDLPAGTWQVTWWDSLKGEPAAFSAVEHPGGTLHLPTPPVSRHAAAVLVR